jgi:hypothetical protein
MKNIFYAFIAIALFGLNSCDEDAVEAGEGTLTMKYEAKVNNIDLELNRNYLINGDSVYFTTVKFYVSDVKIQDKDGLNEIEVKDVALVDFSEMSTTSFNTVLPATAYKNPSFTVGLSDERNNTEPSSYPSISPLSLNTSMYWLMAESYIYFKIEAFRTVNGVETPLVYHVGLDGMGTNASVEKGFSINNGNITTIITTLELTAVFTTIDLATEPGTHTLNNKPLADKMMDNFVNALSIN